MHLNSLSCVPSQFASSVVQAGPDSGGAAAGSNGRLPTAIDVGADQATLHVAEVRVQRLQQVAKVQARSRVAVSRRTVFGELQVDRIHRPARACARRRIEAFLVGEHVDVFAHDGRIGRAVDDDIVRTPTSVNLSDTTVVMSQSWNAWPVRLPCPSLVNAPQPSDWPVRFGRPRRTAP